MTNTDLFGGVMKGFPALPFFNWPTKALLPLVLLQLGLWKQRYRDRWIEAILASVVLALVGCFAAYLGRGFDLFINSDLKDIFGKEGARVAELGVPIVLGYIVHIVAASAWKRSPFGSESLARTWLQLTSVYLIVAGLTGLKSLGELGYGSATWFSFFLTILIAINAFVEWRSEWKKVGLAFAAYGGPQLIQIVAVAFGRNMTRGFGIAIVSAALGTLVQDRLVLLNANGEAGTGRRVVAAIVYFAGFAILGLIIAFAVNFEMHW